MISKIYARRDDIELVSPEGVSRTAKSATLPDFERSFNTNTKIGRELN